LLVPVELGVPLRKESSSLGAAYAQMMDAQVARRLVKVTILILIRIYSICSLSKRGYTSSLYIPFHHPQD
jgi:hypothetical protein